MNIKRINNYEDKRFSKNVLLQHGAFLINDDPYEIEIICNDSAIVRGKEKALYLELINEFRFYAEHITKLFNQEKDIIIEFQKIKTFILSIEKIQPSQFWVDKDKIIAVSSFVKKSSDIIIPLLKYGDRYISLDGHTRLALAINKGFTEVMGFETNTQDYIYDFVDEAKKRKIFTPFDLKIVDHEQYEILWNDYCDKYWANREER